ncbi:MAG: sensor histidine kinase [Thermodesulfobacteriota bacterium]
MAQICSGAVRKPISMGQEILRFPHRKPLLLQEEKLLLTFVDLYRDSDLRSFVKGLVHNLNGHLQLLSMRVEIILDFLTKAGDKIDPSFFEKGEKCLDEVEKMKAFLNHLLEREDEEERRGPRPIDLNELIEQELWFLRNHLFFKHQVEVRKAFTPALPSLKGFPKDFRKALSNLLLNAIEAMGETPQKVLTVVTETQGDSVAFTVRDTGCGISEEVRPHLFTPFFTTKGRGHHGLGLFMARELLAPYGASFEFSSQERTTLFSVHFPIQPASP